MNPHLQHDLDHLSELLESVKNQSLGFLNRLNDRHTSNSHDHTTDDSISLNPKGLGGQETLKLFNQRFEPYLVGSSGPRYWGFVTGGSTPAATMGDWLATVFDQNTQTTKGQGDVSASIEVETIQLLLDLLGLPQKFFGGFVTGATLSNFTCLATARQWIGKELGKDFAKEGLSQPIQVLSATPHSSAIKCLSMLGIGSQNLTQIKTQAQNREAIDLDDLEKEILALHGAPFVLITSAGTVNTADFDDFAGIASLRKKYRFWWHVDAAFGGYVACSPKYQHLVKGWESADSLCIDNHKWLNVPYESAFFLILKKHQMEQVETFQNSNAPYLGDPMENFNYLNFLPENSRRLRALPAWFSLRAYGKEGYQEIIENSVDRAKQLSHNIEESSDFVLLAPTRLNNVCFTLTGDENQHKVSRFLAAINETGKVFMTPTVYQGKQGIRASFVNWRTTDADVTLVFEIMTTTVQTI
ncbi:amino acid decarboxylase [Reichenbachiella sp. 5M10]|uniref:pyridoxal phosphate-dependent decarboxylase family protein n=1 Tax=Reichenbachiella sp. 5M10 TaxID=1889772 RepID=UPI000C14AD55|nr:pyridoxal-dependent decarboxylase [Reichenbachiella sp. 5M10]PIB36959.1 amino acid decarboxylase [Reichenbachiella sp. 5M10]